MLDFNDLETAWALYSDRLLLILRSHGGPVEDAVQEAFMALADQPHLPDCPLAWLVTVARNRLLQWERGERRRATRQAQVARDWFAPTSVEHELDLSEISAALSSLPPPQAEIITMRIWGEMTFEQIAQIVGLSRSTTHRCYMQGLNELRHIFKGITHNE